MKGKKAQIEIHFRQNFDIVSKNQLTNDADPFHVENIVWLFALFSEYKFIIIIMILTNFSTNNNKFNAIQIAVSKP